MQLIFFSLLLALMFFINIACTTYWVSWLASLILMRIIIGLIRSALKHRIAIRHCLDIIDKLKESHEDDVKLHLSKFMKLIRSNLHVVD